MKLRPAKWLTSQKNVYEIYNAIIIKKIQIIYKCIEHNNVSKTWFWSIKNYAHLSRYINAKTKAISINQKAKFIQWITADEKAIFHYTHLRTSRKKTSFEIGRFSALFFSWSYSSNTRSHRLAISFQFLHKPTLSWKCLIRHSAPNYR